MSDPFLVSSTGGAEVALHDLGGSGPSVLLCHATGFCGRMWQPVADRLVSLARCWALDFRGHGHSTAAEGEQFGWSSLAEDVLAAVDALDSPPRLAAGHSMGGATIVLAELARPGTFARAWLYEPVILVPPYAPPPQGNPLAAIARKRREVFDSRQAAYDRFSSRPPLDVFTPETLRAYVDHGFRDLPDGSVALRCASAVEAAVFENARDAAFDGLDGVCTTVTVAVGAQDGEDVPAAVAAPVAESLPDAELVRFEGLGHFGPMQDPDVVAASIAETLLGV